MIKSLTNKLSKKMESQKLLRDYKSYNYMSVAEFRIPNRHLLVSPKTNIWFCIKKTIRIKKPTIEFTPSAVDWEIFNISKLKRWLYKIDKI